VYVSHASRNVILISIHYKENFIITNKNIEMALKSTLKSSLKKNEGKDRQHNLKEVKFDNVEIRYYPQVLSTNPATQLGLPVELDWQPIEQDTQQFPLESFEKMRTSKVCPRRKANRLYLSAVKREEILRARNLYTEEELKAAEKAKNMDRFLRELHNTLLINPWFKVKSEVQIMKTEVMVKRAVKNLSRSGLSKNTVYSKPSEPADIYRNWWIPDFTQ